MAEEDRAALAQQELNILGISGKSGSQGPKAMDQEPAAPSNENEKWTEKEWDQHHSRKWPRQESKGTGRSYDSWGSHGKRQRPETSQSSGTLDKQTQVLLQLMTRMTLRHEHELCRLRTETSFVMFCDTAEHGILPKLRATAENWQTQYINNAVNTSLKVIMMMSWSRLLREQLDRVL